MKFKINNRNWEIKEEIQENICKETNRKYITEDGRYFGICDYVNQIIYIDKELHKEQKRETLIHELFHCYMACYVSFEDMEWHEDIICNLVANSHDIIHKIVEDYFKEV